MRVGVLWLFPFLTILGPALAAETDTARPPEGAIILFDGKDTSRWTRAKMTEDGYLMAGAISKEKFGDCIIHLEFNIQPHPQGRRVGGNSGVYIQRRYEIQILNTHGRKPSRGGCGAIYQVRAPSVNAARPPGEWQTYHITFRAPRWEGKKKIRNARISVIHNGVLIHDNVEVPNKTGSGRREGPEPGPLYLQYHGNKVLFRNVWILPLKPDDEAASSGAR